MADDNETWLPIVGYEDLYEVSDRGRVRSLDRITPRRRGRILKPAHGGDGYEFVSLSRDGQVTSMKIHRLVAIAFVVPPTLEVCHDDGDPLNNRADNLRWDTRSSNHRDKRRHGTDHNARKTHCKWGHEFTDENTWHGTSNGWNVRSCRACKRRQSQELRDRRKVARMVGS